MESKVFESFAKHALALGTLRSYLGARAAQGVGGASALRGSLVGTRARTSRQAVQGMSGLQKHRLSGVAQGGKDVRRMQELPAKAGLEETAKRTRARVGQVIQQETTNPAAARAGGMPLSKSYEGYKTDSTMSYSPQHVEQVMGLAPGSVKLKEGPTAFMRPTPKAPTSTDVTVPSASRVRRRVRSADVTTATGRAAYRA
jgi:hypothetical protein